MRFTTYHSMNEVMDHPGIRRHLPTFFSGDLLRMFPPELGDEPLGVAEHYGQTPWDIPFFEVVEQFLEAANLIVDITENGTRRYVPLWDKDVAPTWEPRMHGEGDPIDSFLVAPLPHGTPSGERRPAVIICPGGAYREVCCSGEGTPVMRMMEVHGYVAFILFYQVSAPAYPQAQTDLAQAVRLVRAHADEYGVDPDDIMTMGFSAGGHLCASEAAIPGAFASMADERRPDLAGVSARPDKVCLGYPVISLCQHQHEESVLNLIGDDESLRKPLSVERMVDRDFPPTYLWTCADDSCVPPENSGLMDEALEAAGVNHLSRLYPEGEHGCGLAFGKSAHGWSQEMLSFMRDA